MEIQASKVFRWNNDALNSDKRFIINQGGSRCLAPFQLVKTTKGYKPISNINIGDEVYSYNEDSNQIEVKKVLLTYENENEKQCYRIKLKSGTVIEASLDHKFFFQGGWVSLKNIVSLYYDMEKNKRF